MWKKKIRFNKIHYLLIAVMLLISSMIIGLGAGYVFETNAYVKAFYFTEDNPDICVISEEGGYELLKKEDRIVHQAKSVSMERGLILNDVMKVDGVAMLAAPTVFACNDYREINLSMSIFSGNGKDAPTDGEIWLPYAYCDYMGIAVGDAVTIGEKEFRLTTTFISPFTASPFSQFYPLFVSSGSFDSFEGGRRVECIAVKAGSQDQIASLFREIGNTIGEILGGGTLPTIASIDTKSTNITGNIAIAAAVVMFLVVLFVMGITIKNNLTKQLKCIGTYRLMGSSAREIKAIYRKGYLAAGAVGILLGGLIALPIVQAMCANATRLLGQFSLSWVSLLTYLATALALGLGLYAAIAVHLKRIDRITPVEALTLGANGGVRKLKRCLVKNARSPLSMAVNEIFLRKRQSFSVAGILAVAFLLSFMFVSIGLSLGRINDNIAAYSGLPNGDCYISSGVDEDVYDTVKRDKNVKSAVLNYLAITRETIEGKVFTGVSSQNCSDYVTAEIPYLKGRAPKAKNEVAVSKQILAEIGKDVGDYVAFQSGDKVESKLVVGTFSLIMGNQFTIQSYGTEEELMALGEQAGVVSRLIVSLRLAGGTQEEFKVDYESRFGNILVEYDYPDTAIMTEMMLKIINPIVVILTAMFLTLSFLIVFNMLMMNYLDNKRSYGILKSMGFTTGYIVCKSFLKTAILALFGIAVGLIIGSVTMPILYLAITGAKAFVHSWVADVLLAAALLLLVALAAAAFAVPVQKISPKNLMEE